MRFNDYHKQISAALKLTPEKAREFRVLMMRCYHRQISPNACLALVRAEMEKAACNTKSSTQAT